MRRLFFIAVVSSILLTSSIQAETISRVYASSVATGFTRGDCNSDGVITMADAIYLMQYLYGNGPEPVPVADVADTTCRGVVDIIDVIYILNHVLRGGPKPKCPNQEP